MRVAVCFSGHMRTYNVTFPTFRQHVLQHARNWEIDYFVHTWDKLGWLSHENGRVLDGENAAKSISEHEATIRNMYNPKAMVIEPEKEFDLTPYEADRRKLYKPGSKGIHIPSMYYKIKACNELKCQYEREHGFVYDAVVRLRPDAFFDRPATFVRMPIKPRSLYIPQCGHWGGVNDMFAMGRSEIMDIYANCYDHLHHYISRGCEVRPEPLLLMHLKSNRIKLEAIEYSFSILRADNTKMVLSMPWLATAQGRQYAREIR